MDYNNKYVNHYYGLIAHARKQKRRKGGDAVYEEHHIIPKSLGGTNKKDNLVLLTPREHYLAHYLLYKFNHTKEATDSIMAMSKNKEYEDYIICEKFYDNLVHETEVLRFAQKAKKRRKNGSKFEPIAS